MTLLKRLALATSRTSQESERASATSGNAMRLLYTVLLVSLLGLFLPAFVTQFKKWNSFKPETVLPSELWHVLYKDPGISCPNDASRSPACPAHPDNPALWQSRFEQKDLKHKDRLVALGPKPYWIGATISPAILREAGLRRANQLLLGWIHASYRIWIDGNLQLGGIGHKDTHPIILSISPERLKQAKAMQIAVHIYHDSDYGMPDLLNKMRGGEGFLTPMTASVFRDFVVFWETVRPFSLLIAYMVIGSLFFSFWLGTRSKSEYFYMALFALTSAFYQARMTSILTGAVSRSMTTDLDVVLRSYIACFGMALGFSFARARLSYFKWGMPLALALPPLLAFGISGSHSKHVLTGLIQGWVTPAFYLLGGLTCLVQASHLYSERRRGSPTPVRVRRLVYFAVGMTVLAVFNVMQYHGAIPQLMKVMWMGLGFEHFVFVVVFGTITLTEYREPTALAANTTSRSRRPLFSKDSEGVLWLVNLDCPDWLRTVFLSHLHTAVVKNGGALFERERALVAFFEHDKNEIPTLSALRAADELAYHLHLLSDAHGCALRFHSALTANISLASAARLLATSPSDAAASATVIVAHELLADTSLARVFALAENSHLTLKSEASAPTRARKKAA